MPRSYTLLNDKDNAIRRNQRHLINMGSNFIKTENDNDMNNDRETEPKQEIARQQLNLERWVSLGRMRLNFKKYQATQLNQEEE